MIMLDSKKFLEILADFFLVIKGHIIEKGKKYDENLTATTLSDMYWIDSIRKYADEYKAALENGDENGFSENLLSIAHVASILYFKRHMKK